MLTRREAAQALVAATMTATLGKTALAADKVVKIAIMMAIDGCNEGNGIPGVRLEPLVLDDGTATAGQYDPAQAATNARKMVSDSRVVAASGPQMSGSGKAMSPI